MSAESWKLEMGQLLGETSRLSSFTQAKGIGWKPGQEKFRSGGRERRVWNLPFLVIVMLFFSQKKKCLSFCLECKQQIEIVLGGFHPLLVLVRWGLSHKERRSAIRSVIRSARVPGRKWKEFGFGIFGHLYSPLKPLELANFENWNIERLNSGLSWLYLLSSLKKVLLCS